MHQVKTSPAIDRVIGWSLDNPLSRVTRYSLATLLVTVVAVVRAELLAGLVPWLLFVPLALVISLFAGRRTGLYSVVLAAILAGYSIGTPAQPLWITPSQWLAGALFLCIGALVVALAAELRAAFRRTRLLAADRAIALEELVERDGQRELLNHELGHRIKNLLTVVQAVAGQTIRQSPDLGSAGEALGARLAALGRATDALTANAWTAADLRTLAADAFQTHRDRISCNGPPVAFSPQVAMALTLTFHELLTNSTKYGALSNDDGRVDVDWSVGPGANADGLRFMLTWRESGGPPVKEPTRRGFGSVMIERSLKSYLRGETSIHYRPDGLVFTIDAPLATAVMEGNDE